MLKKIYSFFKGNLLLFYFIFLFIYLIWIIFSDQVYYNPGDDVKRTYKWYENSFAEIFSQMFSVVTHIEPLGYTIIPKVLYTSLQFLTLDRQFYEPFTFTTACSCLVIFCGLYFSYALMKSIADKYISMVFLILMFFLQPRSVLYYSLSTYMESWGFLGQILAVYIFIQKEKEQSLNIKNGAIIGFVLLLTSFFRHESIFLGGIIGLYIFYRRKVVLVPLAIVSIGSLYYLPKLFLQNFLSPVSYFNVFSGENTSWYESINFILNNLTFSYFSILIFIALIYYTIIKKDRLAEILLFVITGLIICFFFLFTFDKLKLIDRYLFVINNLLIICLSYLVYKIRLYTKISKNIKKTIILILILSSYIPISQLLRSKTYLFGYHKNREYELFKEAIQYIADHLKPDQTILIADANHKDITIKREILKKRKDAKIDLIKREVKILTGEHNYLIVTGASYNIYYKKPMKFDRGWGHVRSYLYLCKTKENPSLVCYKNKSNLKIILTYEVVFENKALIILHKINPHQESIKVSNKLYVKRKF